MNNKLVMEILEKAAFYISVLKSTINADEPESERNVLKGTIHGLLEASRILTGKAYTWDCGGIYDSHGNLIVVKVKDGE